MRGVVWVLIYTSMHCVHVDVQVQAVAQRAIVSAGRYWSPGWHGPSDSYCYYDTQDTAGSCLMLMSTSMEMIDLRSLKYNPIPVLL